ncbi:MAG: PQQ-dependent sugar dehydrogenase, partial [Saprospiraceae bacterium]|nr:PQQ-dependent sugar dehydrogenase [Saprospiraceae bacterium]
MKNLFNMKKAAYFFLIALGITVFASCKPPSAPPANGNTSTSVETKAPNTAYKPAFEGQTRVKGVKTTTPYEFKVLSEDLESPWGIQSLPDGRMLITQKKEGDLKIVKPNGELSSPVKGLPAVNSGGQGGLLGITIDPAFEQNR